MKFFSYWCPFTEHSFDLYLSTATTMAPCPEHDVLCSRDYSTIQINPSNDPYRRAHLKGVPSNQDRSMDPLAPKDKFDVKHVEQATGRTYFGNDLSKLDPSHRTVLEKNIK